MPLREKNPKWLQNDYVKFIRFAQWRIERTGHGILGFITDNSYLDNPTFRGMRQSLMQCFSEIHVYDLHGNSKKPDVAPDGGEDRNVFDIQQGAAIILAVKTPNQEGLADVYHAELWGLREHKYNVLSDTDVTGTKWTQLHPTTPNYYFFPQVTDLLAEYEQAWKLTDAMPLNVTGFQSHRDPFAIAFDKQTIMERMKRLRDAAIPNDEIREEYNIPDNRDWNLAGARAELRENKAWESAIIRCSYRPLDWRWCYFGTVTMDYPRTELTENMAGKENLALNVCRQTKAPRWQHALVSDTPAPAVYVELKDGSNVFPLYLYPDSKQQTLHAEERQTNFSAKFIADLSNKLKLAWTDDGKGDLETTVGPEDVFAFAYAVLNAPGSGMEQTLHQLGGLLLGAVPTVILLWDALHSLHFSGLSATHRRARRARSRTQGAMEKARADIAAAEARTADYEQRLREARQKVFKNQEARRQQAIQSRSQAVNQARARAQEQVKQARAGMEADMQQAMTKLQADAARLASDIVRTVLRPVASPSQAGGQ